MPKVSIARESPDQKEVLKILAASDAYMAALYPAESNHAPDLEKLLQPDIIFLVARVDGNAVGCAGLVLEPDNSAEVKRMYVAETARGLGIGRQLMSRLEEETVKQGLQTLRLETGIHQPEAIALYRAFGFTECSPFGSYKADPLSIFMEKTL